MLLKNKSARLITVNGTMVNNMRSKVYKISPGDNPSVEIPDEVCKGNKFIQGLIKDGSLERVSAEITVEDGAEREPSQYDDMNKADVKTYAETLEIDVKSSWSKDKIIDEILKVESE